MVNPVWTGQFDHKVDSMNEVQDQLGQGRFLYGISFNLIHVIKAYDLKEKKGLNVLFRKKDGCDVLKKHRPLRFIS